MAITSIGTLGSANDKTAGTTITMTSSANAEVGNLVIVRVAANNIGTTEADDTTEHTVTDESGNTWNKAKEYRYSAGAAADGVTSSLWYTVVTTQIDTGDDIICTFSGGSPAASAITAWEFDIGASSVAVAGVHVLGGNANHSLSLSSLTSREYLWVHHIGREGIVGDAPTPEGTYTAMTADYTAGGGTATNIGTIGAYLISTDTGEAAASSGTVRDNVAMLVAIYEVTSTAHTMATTIAATGTVSPSLKGAHPMAALIAGTGTVSPSLKGAHPMAATIDAVGTLAAAVKVNRGLSTQIDAVGTVAPALTVTTPGGTAHDLAAVIAGVGTVAPALRAGLALQTSVAGSATVDPSLRLRAGMTTSIDGLASVSPALRLRAGLQTSIDGSAAVSPALRAGFALATVINAQLNVVPQLTDSNEDAETAFYEWANQKRKAAKRGR